MSEIHVNTDAALRTKALEALLVEKGLVSSEAIDRVVKEFEEDIGPMRGAQVVAKAWVDPDFRKRLLEDGQSAIAEFGFTERPDTELVVVENTDEVHNVVVCTLCSCYPWAVLGLPPTWYKSYAYRARVVREPRKVLKEFGLELPESVEVRVWDSNSDLRYMVLPVRPDGTDHLDEASLASLVTRDSMIGVTRL